MDTSKFPRLLGTTRAANEAIIHAAKEAQERLQEAQRKAQAQAMETYGPAIETLFTDMTAAIVKFQGANASLELSVREYVIFVQTPLGVLSLAASPVPTEPQPQTGPEWGEGSIENNEH